MSLKELFSSSKKRLEALETSVFKSTRQIKNLNNELREQKEVMNSLISQIKDLHQTQQHVSLGFQDAVKDINKITMELAMFKPSLEKSLLEKSTVKLDQELSHMTNKISAQLSGFSQSKESLKDIFRQIKSVEAELVRIKDLGVKICAQDYDLSRYAQELDRSDKQKLELMKRVDELERMLAKLKRENK